MPLLDLNFFFLLHIALRRKPQLSWLSLKTMHALTPAPLCNFIQLCYLWCSCVSVILVLVPWVKSSYWLPPLYMLLSYWSSVYSFYFLNGEEGTPTIICSSQVTLYRISACSTSYCKSDMWLIKFSNYYFWRWSRNIKKKFSDFNQQDICTSSFKISIKEYLKQVLPKAVTSKIWQIWKFPW